MAVSNQEIVTKIATEERACPLWQAQPIKRKDLTEMKTPNDENKKELVALFYSCRDLHHPKMKTDRLSDDETMAIVTEFILNVKRHYQLTDQQAIPQSAKLIKKLFQYEDEFNTLRYGILSVSVLSWPWIIRKLFEIASGPYQRQFRKKRTERQIRQKHMIALLDEKYDNEPMKPMIEEIAELWT
jgi:hypothetical protein